MSVSALWNEYNNEKKDDLKQKLTIYYMGLVKYQVKWFSTHVNLPTCIDRDDLESCGTIGLMEAIDKFDPHGGSKFESIAINKIRWVIWDEIRRFTPSWKVKKNISNISLDQTILYKNSNELKISDIIEDHNSPDPLQSAIKNNERELLLKAIERLGERDKQIIKLYYYQEGMTMDKIGNEIGISGPRVGKLHSRAIVRLRREILKGREY